MAVQVIYGTKQTNAEIVSLEMAKQNSRIEYNDEDSLLQLLLNSATNEIENYLSSPVILRENSKIYLDVFQKTYNIKMPFLITKVEWLDIEGNKTEIATSDYEIFGNEVIVDIEKPDNFDRILFTADLGYEMANIPSDIQRAALLIFSNSETYRESVQIKFNQSAYSLLRNYKLKW